ncbi:mercury(II) reductase [Hyphomonas johnsonii]|uniref:Mercuric reductase n=1 Tax=Hyphomonas johnsonii MHS-2 TaxID=1280950 RepID=A0A059FSN2_9PROT|nr:mercury(II) reductase [Hyphomonas johnsonii]KCZ93506.1 dihydrolipoamide dehydrogenase [Hyphomonas johnsonii MHS-2]
MTHTSSEGRDHYDLIVIGAGSAGFSAAITAAEANARVALIGWGTIGGTCVNIGCVPSKVMIRAAEALHGARTASRFQGLSGEARIDDWTALMADKDNLVETLRNKKYIDLLSDYETVDYIEGKAVLTQGGVMISERFVKADRTIIATGASPAIPDLQGLSETPYLDSTAALELGALPESLLVMGGGYIGCELAQMFARAGTQVTLVTRSHLLPEAEPEISSALTDYLADENITVRTGLDYVSTRKTEAGVALTISVGGREETLEAGHLLLTTGRRANTAKLGLSGMGIQTHANGAILVDERMRTTRPGVYAAGDVTGQDQFVYMAAYGAKIAARNALDSNSLAYDNAAMPWVVFTDPQVAGVGLSEAQAIKAGHSVKTSIAPLGQVPRALAAHDTRGLIKLVADADTDVLLGAQILAPEGSDSIQTMVMALKFGMTAKALGETLFPYLTTVEGLKLAAQGFGKDVAKLSCCAG